MAFPNNLSQEMPLQPYSDHRHLPQNSPTATNHHPSPTWLNSSVLRQQSHFSPARDPNFLNLHTSTGSSSAAVGTSHWLQASNDTMIAAAISREPADLINNNNSNTNNDSAGTNDNQELTENGIGGSGGGGSGSCGEGAINWETARYKAEILSHPLYEQLLSAHVSCLRIATPVDQLPRVDAELAQSQEVVAKYLALGHGNLGDGRELEQFMTHYLLLLCSFKEQLQQHVRVHAMEAVMACWEIEQSLQSLTGASLGEGTSATMSDDDNDPVDSDTNLIDGSFDGPDSMGFGPLIPTESERSLMERVRQELKHELKHGYKDKLVDIREEILRKRRAGKLPGDTTSVLKAWWQSHSKWPYPTEEDKARLVQETGLQLKQVNNWFINQRKRNWHNNPSSSAASRSKRRR